MRKIYELKKDKVTGDWGRWQNVELQDASSSPNIRLMIKKD